MNQAKTILISAVVALAVAAGTAVFISRQSGGSAETESASAYDRVLTSGTIRAAYVNYPPGCTVDPKSGEVSGIFIDVLKKIGENTGLKVEYTEEVGWATLISGLDSGRYDIIGSPVWANSTRGKLATLSKPVYFSGIGVWVRPNEVRFSDVNNWESLNAPDVRIAAMDGSTPETIAKTMFPNARLVTYPDLAGEPQLFLDVTSGKVDVFFAEPSQGIDFLKSNPGKIKNVASEKPIKVFPNTFMMKGGEQRLKSLIDTALEELQNSGYVDQVIRKYEPGPRAFYRVALPYQGE